MSCFDIYLAHVILNTYFTTSIHQMQVTKLHPEEKKCKTSVIETVGSSSKFVTFQPKLKMCNRMIGCSIERTTKQTILRWD